MIGPEREFIGLYRLDPLPDHFDVTAFQPGCKLFYLQVGLLRE